MSENEDLSVLIMAGGAGTRFWPVSTEARPKQFLALLGERSLLQASVDRLGDLVPPERILVLTSARFVDLVAEQLPQLPRENIIGEPMRRDTAAAVALGALVLARRFGPGIMAVLTADHRIEPPERFREVLLAAADGARRNPRTLYTFGIRPDHPSTAYGYLHRGDPILDAGSPPQFQLRSFREKPPAAVAEQYLASGEYYWNSGMFVWSQAAIVHELERQLPGHLRALEPALGALGRDDFPAALAQAFTAIESVSIDFGIMEGAQDVRCVEATFTWSDVGGWLALQAFLDPDGEGNSVRGRVHALQASDNIVFVDGEGEEVALVGVEGLVVVRAGNRTLVCDKRRAEAIKDLVARLPQRLR